MKGFAVALILASALSTAACQHGPSEALASAEGWGPESDLYEQLLGCYANVMESKGLDLDSPDSDLARYDSLARRKCARQIHAFTKALGTKRFEEIWPELWGEYVARI